MRRRRRGLSGGLYDYRRLSAYDSSDIADSSDVSDPAYDSSYRTDSAVKPDDRVCQLELERANPEHQWHGTDRSGRISHLLWHHAR
jgi:hypothetical protein